MPYFIVLIFLLYSTSAVFAEEYGPGVLISGQTNSPSGILIAQAQPIEETIKPRISKIKKALELNDDTALIKELLRQNRIRTIEDYAQWLGSHIQYVRDTGQADNWAKPMETLLKRQGDCEDFSLLSAEVLRIFGHRPRVLVVAEDGFSHAFTVFRDQGRYVVLDNEKIIRTRTKSFDELTHKFRKNEKTKYILELMSHRKQDSRVLYKRS